MFGTTALAIGMMAWGGLPPDEVMTVSATLTSSSIEAGSHEIELTVDFADGWSGSDAGIPKPLLQIEVPGGVSLDGKRVTAYRQLARNEFVMEPFERLISPGTTEIAFSIADVDAVEQGRGGAIGLNVIAYVSEEGSDEAYMVRRRLDVPLTAGMTVTGTGQATNSAWTPNDGYVWQIGDEVDDVKLPRADGSLVDLGSYAGEKNIIVTTYRAFW